MTSILQTAKQSRVRELTVVIANLNKIFKRAGQDKTIFRLIFIIFTIGARNKPKSLAARLAKWGSVIKNISEGLHSTAVPKAC